MGRLVVPGLVPHMHTLEDEYRARKVPGETSIPAGIYEIRLRTEGGMHQKYARRFPWHVGMLWLQDVPGFEWIYIHIGNDDDDTDGCILVGETRGPDWIGESVKAYTRLYQHIVPYFDTEPVQIEIRDA